MVPHLQRVWLSAQQPIRALKSLTHSESTCLVLWRNFPKKVRFHLRSFEIQKKNILFNIAENVSFCLFVCCWLFDTSRCDAKSICLWVCGSTSRNGLNNKIGFFLFRCALCLFGIKTSLSWGTDSACDSEIIWNVLVPSKWLMSRLTA